MAIANGTRLNGCKSDTAKVRTTKCERIVCPDGSVREVPTYDELMERIAMLQWIARQPEVIATATR